MQHALSIWNVARDHSERQRAEKRHHAPPWLDQFRIDGQGFVRSSQADIAQQGKTEKCVRRCRIRWKISVEGRYFGVVSGLEEGRGFGFDCGRSFSGCGEERNCGEYQNECDDDTRSAPD